MNIHTQKIENYTYIIVNIYVNTPLKKKKEKLKERHSVDRPY